MKRSKRRTEGSYGAGGRGHGPGEHQRGTTVPVRGGAGVIHPVSQTAHRVDKLTAQHVQAFLAGKRASGLSPKTVAYIRGILRTALAQAVRWRLVAVNVATMVDPPRLEHHEVHPLTADEARRFIDATKDDRLGALFHVAIATGLRQGELFGLRWDDIDFEKCALRVRHAMQRVDGKPVLVAPKTALSRRTVSLIPSALAALRTQRTRQNEERLLAGVRWQDWNLVFSSSVGTPLNGSNVSKRLHALLEGAGLRRQRFHDLRHCAASLMLAGGVDLRTIKHAPVAGDEAGRGRSPRAGAQPGR